MINSNNNIRRSEVNYKDLISGTNLDIRETVSCLKEKKTTQAKANKKHGKKVKPHGGHESPHPYRGKMVGEEEVEEAHGNSKIYDKCWDGYEKVPGKKRGEKGSCRKKTDEGVISLNTDLDFSKLPKIIQGFVDDFLKKDQPLSKLEELLTTMGHAMEKRGNKLFIYPDVENNPSIHNNPDYYDWKKEK